MEVSCHDIIVLKERMLDWNMRNKTLHSYRYFKNTYLLLLTSHHKFSCSNKFLANFPSNILVLWGQGISFSIGFPANSVLRVSMPLRRQCSCILSRQSVYKHFLTIPITYDWSQNYTRSNCTVQALGKNIHKTVSGTLVDEVLGSLCFDY